MDLQDPQLGAAEGLGEVVGLGHRVLQGRLPDPARELGFGSVGQAPFEVGDGRVGLGGQGGDEGGQRRERAECGFQVHPLLVLGRQRLAPLVAARPVGARGHRHGGEVCHWGVGGGFTWGSGGRCEKRDRGRRTWEFDLEKGPPGYGFSRRVVTYLNCLSARVLQACGAGSPWLHALPGRRSIESLLSS